MTSYSGEADEAEVHRCNVCGREFESEETLEQHVRDQGLLW